MATLILTLKLIVMLFFFFCVGSLGYGAAHRLLKTAPVSIKWLAAYLIAGWILSVLFFILISIGYFSPVPAIGLALSAFIIMNRLHFLRDIRLYLSEDLSRLKASIESVLPGTIPKLTLILTGLFSLFLIGRCLVIPMMGWDSMTYHQLKAGMWVQEAGPLSYSAPGAWEYYETFFGGGEMFTAWAMVFTHSVHMAALPDAAHWLALGLVVFSVARATGLPRQTSALVSAAVLCAPELARYVGSGYVDTPATVFLLAGLLFLMRFLANRHHGDLLITVMALGMASSIKVNMFAVSCLIMIVACIAYLRTGDKTPGRAIYYALAFVAPVLYWLLHNLGTSGFLLGSTPLEIGPLVLGQAPPNLQWFLHRPDVTPYAPADELKSFADAMKSFGPVLLFTIPGLAYLPVLACSRRKACFVLPLSLSIIVVALYFSPSFSIIRLGGWSFVNGRFLTPAVILFSIAGAQLIHRHRNGARMVGGISAIAVLYGLCIYLNTFVYHSGNPAEYVVVLTASILFAGGWLLLMKQPNWFRIAFLPAILLILLGAVRYYDQTRPESFSKSNMIHDTPKYWVPALNHLDRQTEPVRLAVVHAWAKIGHAGMFAPFMGTQLQNEIIYVNPDRSGQLIPHHPAFVDQFDPDFDIWIERLNEQKISYVFCVGNSAELNWMRSHPNVFEEVETMEKRGGLFRLRKEIP